MYNIYSKAAKCTCTFAKLANNMNKTSELGDTNESTRHKLISTAKFMLKANSCSNITHYTFKTQSSPNKQTTTAKMKEISSIDRFLVHLCYFQPMSASYENRQHGCCFI